MKKRKTEFREADLSEWAPNHWGRPLSQAQWILLLVQACKEGHLEHVKTAEANGAEINGVARVAKEDEDNLKFQETDGVTPLHAAAHSGKNSKLIVEFLLAHGGDIYKKNEQTNRGMMPDLPIFRHIYFGRTKTVELLLNKADELKLRSTPLLEEKSIIHDHTPLLASVCGYYEKPEVVQFLLNRRADINACTSLGESVLMLCVTSGHSKSLEQLLKWPGFPVSMLNSRDKEGNTALHLAAYQKVWLAHEGDLNPAHLWKMFSNRLQDTLPPPSEFSEHFSKPYFDIINLLLHAGADVEAKNSKGETPLGSVIDKRNNPHVHSYHPEYLNEAKIKLYDQTIELLEKWNSLLRLKLFNLLALQQNLSFLPTPLHALISDYDVYPPPAIALNKSSLFSTSQSSTSEIVSDEFYKHGISKVFGC